MIVLTTGSRDVHRNLAVEEYLLDGPAADEPFLFFWRSDPCVVWGKNQNPWRECRVEELPARGLAMARRLSGGGTVYQDPGNLNFSLVVPRPMYRQDRHYGLILEALARGGVQAEIRNRTSLFADGRKFSGQSFCLRARTAMHHGTLLLDADLGRLRAALESPGGEFDGHAVPSVPSQVVNLSDLAPGVDGEGWIGRFADVFSSEWGGGMRRAGDAEIDGWPIGSLADRMRDPDWILGHTPSFSARWTTMSSGGDRLLLRAEVRAGRVAACRAERAGGRAEEGACTIPDGDGDWFDRDRLGRLADAMIEKKARSV